MDSENSQVKIFEIGEVASPTEAPLPYPIAAHLTERQMKARLYAKMARVMGKMTRLEKNGENTFFHYKFVTSDDVADLVRAELASEGIAFFADMGDIEDVAMEVTTSKGEKKIVRTRVHFIFTFADGETGYFEERHWVSEAIDDQDKALNKAATAAEKYFLLKTFIIGTGDDPDRDGEKVGRAAKPMARPPAPRPQPQPQAQPQPQNGASQTPQVVKMPKDGKDYETYFQAVAPAYKLTREQAAAFLKKKNNDAVAAAQALAGGER